MEHETLDMIKDALATIDGDKVFYGLAAKLGKKDPWNYTVFSRASTDPSDNLTSFSDIYEVAVVREEYVPEGMLFDVLAAVDHIPGLKLAKGRPIEYRYDLKSGTSDTVEMMVVRFAKSRKRP